MQQFDLFPPEDALALVRSQAVHQFRSMNPGTPLGGRGVARLPLLIPSLFPWVRLCRGRRTFLLGMNRVPPAA